MAFGVIEITLTPDESPNRQLMAQTSNVPACTTVWLHPNGIDPMYTDGIRPDLRWVVIADKKDRGQAQRWITLINRVKKAGRNQLGGDSEWRPTA